MLQPTDKHWYNLVSIEGGEIVVGIFCLFGFIYFIFCDALCSLRSGIAVQSSDSMAVVSTGNATRNCPEINMKHVIWVLRGQSFHKFREKACTIYISECKKSSSLTACTQHSDANISFFHRIHWIRQKTKSIWFDLIHCMKLHSSFQHWSLDFVMAFCCRM